MIFYFSSDRVDISTCNTITTTTKNNKKLHQQHFSINFNVPYNNFAFKVSVIYLSFINQEENKRARVKAVKMDDRRRWSGRKLGIFPNIFWIF
jgi:hypothetical protein